MPQVEITSPDIYVDDRLKTLFAEIATVGRDKFGGGYCIAVIGASESLTFDLIDFENHAFPTRFKIRVKWDDSNETSEIDVRANIVDSRMLPEKKKIYAMILPDDIVAFNHDLHIRLSNYNPSTEVVNEL